MDYTWVKTILTCYLSFDKVIKMLENMVYDKAKSTHTAAFDYPQESTFNQITKLIDLIDKKSRLVNLKVIADTVLEKLELKHAQVINQKFFLGKEPEEITCALNISMRTLHRRLLDALEKFANVMVAMDYDKEWFCDNYFDQSWLKNQYYAFERSCASAQKAKLLGSGYLRRERSC